MKSKGAILGLVVIGAALAFCGMSFKNAMLPYMPIAEARTASDASVQIMGAPVPGTMQYDNSVHALCFSVRDEHGDVMPVVFHGPKPEDLDSAMTRATKVTAQGTFDPKQGVFEADNLLVKCPSKYQGAPGASGGGSERRYGS